MNGQRLKAELLARKLTYQDAADALGISLTAFTRKINELVEFKRNEIEKLAALLDLKPNEVVVIFFN